MVLLQSPLSGKFLTYLLIGLVVLGVHLSRAPVERPEMEVRDAIEAKARAEIGVLTESDNGLEDIELGPRKSGLRDSAPVVGLVGETVWILLHSRFLSFGLWIYEYGHTL